MLFRQACLKAKLLLQLTMLMDELRITSTAELIFSWSFHVTHRKPNTHCYGSSKWSISLFIALIKC